MRQEIEAHTLTTHQVDKIGAKCLVVEEQVDSIEVSISFSIEHTRAYSDLGANAPTHTQIWAPTPLRSGRQRHSDLGVNVHSDLGVNAHFACLGLVQQLFYVVLRYYFKHFGSIPTACRPFTRCA